jgi:bifunctional UDP-N-acetylglucosamine pyrophosphorylase/glucosamine-1-phosphate N-acetyltransferase
MKSSKPKVLHEILGRTILAYVLNAVRYLEPEKLCVVVGAGADEVEAAASGAGAVFVRQREQLGTGHAVMAAREAFKGFKGPLLIAPGDAPLVSPQTLLDLVEAHRALESDLSVLTADSPSPGAYGRVIRDSAGWLRAIVEYRDAGPEERLVTEINSGVYVGSAPEIFGALKEIRPQNAQKEYYLTDLVKVFRERGLKVAAVTGPDPEELSGVNDQEELWRAREVLRLRIVRAWLKAGVRVEDPYTAVIEPGVKLEPDVSLGPGVILQGATRAGAGSVIGPYAVLTDVVVDPGAFVPPHSFLEKVRVSQGSLSGRPHRPQPPRTGGRRSGAKAP